MQDAAADPILNHVEAGRDVRIAGAAASARLGAMAARLEATCNVIRLTAPPGGLSLSALIAQLSGRENFDDHDDGALELGFRRLCGGDAPDRRTVLLLDAAHGVQRPVLRYLQQVAHTAPHLLFVIAGCPELDTFLAAPDMARLRARLGAVVTTGETALVPVPNALPVPALRIPPDWTIDLRRREPPPKRRLGLLWTASGLALAASAAFGFWLGQATRAEGSSIVTQAKTWTAPVMVEPDRRAETAPKPLPPLAAKVEPAPAAAAVAPTHAAAPGAPAAVPIPVLAKSAAPIPAAAAAPPPATLAKAEPVIAASLEERLSLPALHSHRAEIPRARPRVAARPRPPAEVPRYAEDERTVPYYDPDDVAPPRRGRVEYDPYAQSIPRAYGGARYDEDELGPFPSAPYGGRVYRYGP